MSGLKKAFVCGHPIKHSRSPILHNYWLKKYCINGTYEKVDIAPQDLKTFISSLSQNGYVGGNFTLPHKEKLFDLVDEVSEDAQKIGAINTIWYKKDRLIATNTDAYGFSNNLDQIIPNWTKNAPNQTAIVLGAGGASRAVIYALLLKNYKKIILANRTMEKAENIARDFSTNIEPTSIADLKDHLGNTSFFVNATSLGMNPADQLPFEIKDLNPKALVTDIVYTPLKTTLLKSAEKNGNKIVDGLGMLLHQATPGFEKWFGQKPEVTTELYDLIVDDLEAKKT